MQVMEVSTRHSRLAICGGAPYVRKQCRSFRYFVTTIDILSCRGVGQTKRDNRIPSQTLKDERIYVRHHATVFKGWQSFPASHAIDLFLSSFLIIWVDCHRKEECKDDGDSLKISEILSAKSCNKELTVSAPANQLRQMGRDSVFVSNSRIAHIANYPPT